MSDQTLAQISTSHNLKRLFTLRSLLIAVACTVLVGVHQVLSVSMPLLPLSIIIGILSLVNLWTWWRVRHGAVITDREFLYQLCIDVAAIAALLYFSGGATNPFAWLFLIPLMVAATVLSERATWVIAALSIVSYTLLMRYYVPLTGDMGLHHGDSFGLHVFGMWFGFVMSACLIAWFVTAMARNLRTRDRLLADARAKALRDEQLVSLGTLATGTAHDLGTPLGTIAVVTRELERAGLPESTQRKLRILKEQIARCKVVLSALSESAGELRAEGGGPIPVQDFIENLVERWRNQYPDCPLTLEVRAGDPDAIMINELTLVQALINLLNNAAEACSEPLIFIACWTADELMLDILDRGPGLHPQVAAQVSRPKTSDKEFGMGLGLFLSHATIQRMGGDIRLTNRSDVGTRTHIRLPLTEVHARHERAR